MSFQNALNVNMIVPRLKCKVTTIEHGNKVQNSQSLCELGPALKDIMKNNADWAYKLDLKTTGKSRKEKEEKYKVKSKYTEEPQLFKLLTGK